MKIIVRVAAGSLIAMMAGHAAGQMPAQVTILPPATPATVNLHGSTVAVLPDIDGDGVQDIAVGSLFASGNIGRVYVYSGATGQRIRVLSSPTSETDGLYSNSISAVPDVDGDGVADIAVGAPGDSPGNSPQMCGRVYLYSGATGRYLRRLAPLQPEAFGQFGHAVAGLRDVNDDGRGDIAVGAPEDDQPGSPDGGRVYIYSGRTGARIRMLASPGPRDSGYFGYSLAAIPDINGDGHEDLIVGAPKERPDKAGRVYVYSGRTGQILRQMISPAPKDDGRFGYAVAAVPDANGDGVADIVIGAPREYSRQGRVYLYSGATGTLLRVVQSPGLEDNGRFGEAVAGLPDFNGDGYGDFIVGAPHEDPAGSPEDAGRAYIYSGRTGQLLNKIIPPRPASSEYFGYSVAGMADINGNGRPEVVVGAPGEDRPPYGPAGIAYLFKY